MRKATVRILSEVTRTVTTRPPISPVLLARIRRIVTHMEDVMLYSCVAVPRSVRLDKLGLCRVDAVGADSRAVARQ